MSDILGLYASPRLSHLKSRALGIEKKIKEYVMMDDSLSYEYIGKTRDFLFITGWNDIEKELPPFDHPMLIDGLMNKKYIAIDLRKYVKSVTAKPTTLKEIISNYGYAMFQINRVILLDMSLADDSYKLQLVQENLAIIFSNLIASSINTMVKLNPMERVIVEGVAYIYVVGLFLNNYSKEEKLNYFKPILRNAKLSLPLNAMMTDTILGVNVNAKTFDECFENIRYVLGEKKAVVMLKPFYNTLSNLWYGPGTTETVLLSLEDISTMIALYLTAYNDATFKKSRISEGMLNVKRKIDAGNFKKIELRIAEYTH